MQVTDNLFRALKSISVHQTATRLLRCGRLTCWIIAAGLVFLQTACKKDSAQTPVIPPVSPPVAPAFDINTINDSYADVAPFSDYLEWGPHNVHDPAIIKEGDYFYAFSTDAGYGIDVRPGIQIRKSKDLVQWNFLGWVFNSLPSMGADFIKQSNGTPNNSLWAPCVVKAGTEFRLYYSLSSAVPRLSVIGLATATAITGPWTERGRVISSLNDNSVQTNAIDPAVVITPGGEHWMVYGSAWDGIYSLQLDPATGLALVNAAKGKRIANRGFTNGKYNGNIEGADIIYNAAFNKYYLFIAYDWLETKYNVRVMRGDRADGPFYDFDAVDANTNTDHGPMIIAPYRFDGHSGWQGVAHSTAFSDGNGQYFIAHQGRPATDKYFMDLHVRKLFWTADGWPVASPERYAWEDNASVTRDSIIGNWERLVLAYHVVPGYAAEQISADMQSAVPLTIAADGTLNGEQTGTWSYTAPWLECRWSNGLTDRVWIQKGRDWENRKSTLIFSGLNNKGTAIWGKKK